MSRIAVLDASAVIAFLQGEPGHNMVRQVLREGRCVVSAVNQCEIIAKCVDRGMDRDVIQMVLAELDYKVADVTAQDGENAGWLRAQTRAIGLSLGDRMCLALAQRLQAVVLTADRPWLTLVQQTGLDIRCIREAAH